MSDEQKTQPEGTQMTPARRRRNWIIAGVLIAASVLMYFSIFIRLTVNPLE